MVEAQQLLASRQARHQRRERLHSSGSPLSKASFAPAVEETADSWLQQGGGSGSGSDEQLGTSSSCSGTYDEAAWAERESEDGSGRGGGRGGQWRKQGRRHSTSALPGPAAGLLEGVVQLPGGQLLSSGPGVLANAPASAQESAGRARRVGRRASTGLLPERSCLEPVPEEDARFPIYSTNRRLSICFGLDYYNAALLQGGEGGEGGGEF